MPPVARLAIPVSIPSRGFWFFEARRWSRDDNWREEVSIPSRGFWFFEVGDVALPPVATGGVMFQSPRGDFGFLKPTLSELIYGWGVGIEFQSPRGDFGFLKCHGGEMINVNVTKRLVSIPSRGFWFFEAHEHAYGHRAVRHAVSIPSRGFWFFEEGEEISENRKTKSPFQSPRGDFGFLKVRYNRRQFHPWVSIPSRGFWFFEA